MGFPRRFQQYDPATNQLIEPSTGPSSGNSSGSGSKAWIAGAVVGPIVGLALIGLIIFFLRRKKNNKARLASEQSGAAMAPLDPSRPPVGVAGYTDAKPHFAADPTNPHAHTYPQAYPEASTSPAPQYIAPGSPPPPQNVYTNDVKHGYGTPPPPGTAELGGNHAQGPIAHASSPGMHTAELAGQSPQEGDRLFSGAPNPTQPSELSGVSR